MIADPETSPCKQKQGHSVLKKKQIAKDPRDPSETNSRDRDLREISNPRVVKYERTQPGKCPVIPTQQTRDPRPRKEGEY